MTTLNEKVIAGDLKVKGVVTVGENPTPDQELVTREFVLSSTFKDSVKVATTTNITLSGLQTIDSIVLLADDRVLVKNQSTASENGIYVASSGAWTRALDFDTSEKVSYGAFIFVEKGTANGDGAWILSTDDVDLGTTSLVFTSFGVTPDVSGKVNKSGDTMTGDLILSGANLLADNGVSTLGDATHRFASLFLSSVINVADGSTLQIGHASNLNELVLHSSGRVLVGNGTDDTTGKLQVTGRVNISDKLVVVGRTSFGTNFDETGRAFVINYPKTSLVGATQRLLSIQGVFDASIATRVESIETTSVLDGSGTVVHAAGVRIRNIDLTGGASLTNQYGLYIESLTTGTNKYAIYSESGSVKFGGRISVGTDNSSNTYFLSLLPTSAGILSGSTQTGMGLYNGFDATVATAVVRQLDLQNLLGGASNVTESTAMRVNGSSLSGGATVSNEYGIRITDITVGSVSNFAIHTGLGKVSFGDIVEANGNVRLISTKLKLDNGSNTRAIYTDAGGILRFSNAADSGDHFSIDTAGKGLIGSFEVTGVTSLKGLVLNVNTTPKTANYTLVSTDFTIDFDCTSGNLVATLPAAPIDGQVFNVRKQDVSSNELQLNGNGKNINGSATKATTTQYYVWTVQYNGTEWMII